MYGAWKMKHHKEGSVISPLLFLIMMNDIPESPNGVKLSLYGDDSATWKSGRNIALLNRDIQLYLDDITKFFNS